ncbi:hypothetical protein COT75_04885 [Candidatus Beckwithbacteria bacterium CG10_big_fil_rev_8_21_14_0_10_34_10]|uniref:Prolow-density lipoprotein receptor-related protein 1-like beta-propeller domain-containing protein n=1 Tax=Candidatus Beckwithbacteria bacterium CG10_big_fil_rev_8_21_14_0_10_34_10 TaxID=1974495 RepID=A0A2H0WA53_9BACT|nr:MAG: hypothetical protein COT75_04885 [Candidatus Beckwithbacteria bacterium CG10_big_fil_rev_8_21_14_0_10_34_10]
MENTKRPNIRWSHLPYFSSTLLGALALFIFFGLAIFSKKGLIERQPEAFLSETQEEKIIFSSNRDGDDEIYMMNLDGSDVKQLTDNSLADKEAHLSPDGETIVFNRQNSQNSWDLWIMDINGSNEEKLIDLNFSNSLKADFSPDGNKIVYTSAQGELSILDLNNTTNSVLLTKLQATDSHWSSDNKIYFTSYKSVSSGNDIWRIDPNDPGDESTLEWIGGTDGDDYNAFVCGNYVLFTPFDENNGVYTMNKNDGSGLVNISGNRGYAGACSTDESKIIFTKLISPNYEIFTMDINGNNQINVSNNSASEWISDVGMVKIVESMPGSCETSNDCGSSATCENNLCVCDSLQGNCNNDWTDGCETNTYWSEEHCGVCGNVCDVSSGEECVQGVCQSGSSTPEEVCIAEGGTWRMMSNSCLDSCYYAADPSQNCSSAMTYGCDCGSSKCWDGSTCVDNPPLTPSPSPSPSPLVSPSPSPSADQSACEADPNGTWTGFNNSCGDSCELVWPSLIAIACPVGDVFDCDCGETKCWNKDTLKCANNYYTGVRTLDLKVNFDGVPANNNIINLPEDNRQKKILVTIERASDGETAFSDYIDFIYDEAGNIWKANFEW